jgi:hypothetical protein
MAKDTAKKNVKSNETRLLIFYAITALVNALWLLHVFFVDRDAWSWLQIVFAVAFWAGQEALALWLLRSAGAPVFDANGALVECTDLADPSQLGIVAEHAQDLLWVCWALQALTQFVTRAAWVLYAVVPLYVVYRVWTQLVQPALDARRNAEAGELERAAAAAGDGGGQDAKSRLERRRAELRGKGVAKK